MAKPAFDQGKRVSPNNQTIGGKKPKITGEVKYADPPAVKPDESKKLSDVREKFAPNADKPTTASADKGEKNLPSIIQMVDPEGKGQVLPQLYQQMQQMMSIMNMGSGGGGSGAGQNGAPNNVPSGTVIVLQDSFTGALAILTRRYGFEHVVEVFTTLLSNGGINKVDSRFTKIVENALSNLIKLALYFGPLDIPVSVYDETIYGDIVPSPLAHIENIPDFYVKQYFPFDQDPYPGYIKWYWAETGDVVWTKREPQSYYFETATQEIFSTSETELAEDLAPYVKVENPTTPFTVAIFNNILLKQVDNIETNTLNNSVGNNAGGQGSGGGNNMAGALGGQLKSLMQMFQQKQLPKSVLNQGEIGNVLQQFQKDMGLNNQLFQLANGALGGGSPLSSLGNMGGLSNIMSGFGMGGGGIGGVLGNVTGGAGLLGSFGGFGGGSGGGGGGAGSGFPSAGFGNYNGGNITNNGLKNIQQLLTLLGIK